MQKLVLNYLNDIVGKCPDKVAFSDGTTGLTFRDLYNISRQVGTYLHNQSIYRRPVVVYMNKSPKEVAAFLGIITGGNFYVPIDQEMPASRIRLILENVKSPLIICDEETIKQTEGFDEFGSKIVLFDELLKTEINETAIDYIYRHMLDIDPIYIVFTSGSTGVPKGVVACHRSVVDYIEQLCEIMRFDENTVFGNQSPLFFDACLKEIYPTLKYGATAYLIPKKLFSTPFLLVEYLNEHKINTVCWVVSALTMISAFGTFDDIKPEYLNNIAFGSEVFPLKQFRLWRKALPEARFTNLYGPTETTGMCCYYRVEREIEEGEPIPIGQPFPNREIILLDDEDKPAKPGEQGEICIRGNSVTLGYFNDPERTAKAFVQNPLNTAYPEIIYRTGDIGCYNSRGELTFVSRKDFQIKHMGHRIELGEIEADASGIEGVQMTACVYNAEKKKICLYYVGTITEAELLPKLKDMLPRYMCPEKLVRMEALPTTPNGKIDRKALK
ncbi:MAG: amino acid adenylation domain-containing protein [Lachnospiraceae bacterium]|nr:amino acid adenylation domain-containing protein [Lachnospiraceae bacterium]